MSKLLKMLGGIDLQVLGVGGHGHLGFNECDQDDPNYDPNSRTRLVDLSEQTILDNKPSCKQAITMGLATIAEAKQLMLLANGKGKSEIIYDTLVRSGDTGIPSTHVTTHSAAHMYLDSEAAQYIMGC